MGIHYNQGAELFDYVLNKDDFRFRMTAICCRRTSRAGR